MNNKPIDAGVSDPFVSAAELPAPLIVEGPRRKLDAIKANGVLGAVFVGGLAIVYGLSLRNGPAKASAQDASRDLKLDSAVSQFQNADGGKTRLRSQDIMESLMPDVAGSRQVPLAVLRRNPFTLHIKPLESAIPAPLGAAPTLTIPDDGTAQAMAALASLRLQGITGKDGRRVALISNNVLAEGGTVDGWMVVKIEPRQVILSWRDKTHTLLLED